jgi:hypothetical protein
MEVKTMQVEYTKTGFKDSYQKSFYQVTDSIEHYLYDEILYERDIRLVLLIAVTV